MFERLKLNVINFVEKQRERKMQGEGKVFIPLDESIKEVSEAMLIDGALPSNINTAVLKMSKEKITHDKQAHQGKVYKEIMRVGEALLIDGARGEEAGTVLTAVRNDIGTFRRILILNPNQPYRKVNLRSYRR